MFVPWSYEAVDFKNIFCSYHAITDHWKLVYFHVVLWKIMMRHKLKIARWKWLYCNIMVDWVSFLLYVREGLVEILAEQLAIHCATSYLSRQMPAPQNIKWHHDSAVMFPHSSYDIWLIYICHRKNNVTALLHLFAVSGYWVCQSWILSDLPFVSPLFLMQFPFPLQLYCCISSSFLK